MIYLDLETLDWFQDPAIAVLPRWQQLAAVRFGIAVTWDEGNGFRTWLPEQLADLWRELIALQPAVGWNIDEFDLPKLAIDALRTGASRDPWTEIGGTIDLMTLIRKEAKRLEDKERWYKLATIAEANLGRSKTGSGEQAVVWLRSGDRDQFFQAISYCHEDVQLVRDLHGLLLNGVGLICPPRPDRAETTTLTIHLPKGED